MRRSLALVIALALGCTASDPAPPVRPPATTSPAAATPAPASPAAGSPAAMAWSRIADIPTPRSEVAAAAFRDAIYVVGGFGGTRTVERYIPAQRRWERQPDLPVGVDHPMAAAIESGGPGAAYEGVYVMGGYSGGSAIARAFHLASGASAWREIAPMPARRAAGAAVALFPVIGPQGATPRVYVVGGAVDARLDPTTFEYDPFANAWRTRAEIPTPRDHLAAALLDGRACAIGGRRLSMAQNLPALECYDPIGDSWERLPAAPTARGGVGAAVVERKLYLIGGEQPQSTFKEVEIYDADTRQWTRGPDLPTARHGIGVVAFGRAVYVMTGGPRPGGSQTAVCEVLSLR
jgi:N-acetylneuraminic acid mutarotase